MGSNNAERINAKMASLVEAMNTLEWIKILKSSKGPNVTFAFHASGYQHFRHITGKASTALKKHKSTLGFDFILPKALLNPKGVRSLEGTKEIERGSQGWVSLEMSIFSKNKNDLFRSIDALTSLFRKARRGN